MQEYMDMVSDVVQLSLSVTRYTTNTFLRAQLGDALRQRDLAPQLYETAAEGNPARLDPSKASREAPEQQREPAIRTMRWPISCHLPETVLEFCHFAKRPYKTN